jgi:hypothetical protein
LDAVALVLPKDYGWEMRRNEYISQDNILGLWPEDEHFQSHHEQVYYWKLT